MPADYDFSDDNFIPSVRIYLDEVFPTNSNVEVYLKYEQDGSTAIKLFSPTNSTPYKVVFI
jgi:hypothetical protein